MSFTITSNSTLRVAYGNYRSLISKNDRETASNSTLARADSYALKNAIKSLRSAKYTDKKDPTETTGNAKTYSNKLKAFLDTYNNTYESSKASHDSNLKQAASSMKSLVKKYKNELEEVGITIDKDGYLKKSSSSKIETTKPFEDLFGKKSNFLQELDRIPNRIKNHVDILI
jgi:hypothetical protein